MDTDSIVKLLTESVEEKVVKTICVTLKRS